MNLPELLCPAGDGDALNAAIRGGADAVYLGLGAFNARRNAQNFTEQTLKKACDYTHLRGARVYVTLNTIILPSEVDDVLECAQTAYLAGADAFIVQDIGVARLLACSFEGCPVHLSTQANTHDSWGIEAAALLGVKRVTLARELSLPEIAHLAQKARECGMETEVFVHGALCVCYSGQCLMSSMIGGRSANRGLCAQACRLPYILKQNGKPCKVDGEYLLSPKDLSSIDMVAQLARAGVSSLKVEGRMKSSEYVFGVAQTYRSVISRLKTNDEAGSTEEERQRLASVFTRGFTTAYLEGERGNDIMSYQRPNNRGVFIGRVKALRDGCALVASDVTLEEGDVVEFWTGHGRCTQAIESTIEPVKGQLRIPCSKDVSVRPADRVFRVRSAKAAVAFEEFEPRVPVSGNALLALGTPATLSFTPQVQEPCVSDVECAIVDRLAHGNTPCAEGTAQGAIVEPARTKEISAQEVCDHIGRMGQTPYRLDSLEIEMDEGVGIGFSQLHHLRADALDDLTAHILTSYKARIHQDILYPPAPSRYRAQSIAVCALVTNPETARASRRAGAELIYVPALNYKRGWAMYEGRAVEEASQTTYPKDIIVQVPSISHDAKGSSREALNEFDVWEYAQENRTVLVESLAGLVRAQCEGAQPEAGSSLPLTNPLSVSLAAAMGAHAIWLSPELTLAQIAALCKASPVPLGVKVAGAQELMVMEHCPLMAIGPCNQTCQQCRRRQQRSTFEDRMEYEFPLSVDGLGRGHLYNSVQLDIIDALRDLKKAGIARVMVDTTLMTAEQAAQNVGRVVHALQCIDEGRDIPRHAQHTTSGHLHRGVV